MCVCVSVCVCVCMRVHACAHACMTVYVHVYACVCVCVHVCVCVRERDRGGRGGGGGGGLGVKGGQGGASRRWNHLFAITTQKLREKAGLTLKEVKRKTLEEVGAQGRRGRRRGRRRDGGGEEGRVSTCLSSQHTAKRMRAGTTQSTFIAWMAIVPSSPFPLFFGGKGRGMEHQY